MVDEIRVSVIMPVYNADKTLRQCLGDLMEQTLKEIEIICIDDGSTDCSKTLLADISVLDSRITVLKQEHGGAARARNLGISRAKGKYLAILDSDDRFERNMLEMLYHKAEKTHADIVVCGCDGFDSASGRAVPMAWALDHSILPKNDPFCGQDCPTHIFNFTQGWAWDKLYRASFVRQHGLRFQELAATNDMLFVFTSLYKAERISVLKKVLVHQRIGRKDSISSNRHKNCGCFFEALKALKQQLVEDGCYQDYEQSYKNWAVSLSAWQLNSMTSQPESFAELYDMLRNEILPQFEIQGLPERYFLRKHRRQYRQCCEIMNVPLNEYLYRRWQLAISQRAKPFFRVCVNDDGTSELRPITSELARKVKSINACIHEYGIVYFLKLLYGMKLGKRK